MTAGITMSKQEIVRRARKCSKVYRDTEALIEALRKTHPLDGEEAEGLACEIMDQQAVLAKIERLIMAEIVYYARKEEALCRA